MAWLTIRTNDGRDPISTADLDDFTVDGRSFRIKDRQQGIWKPAPFRATLSIQTLYRADGRTGVSAVQRRVDLGGGPLAQDVPDVRGRSRVPPR